MKLIKHPAKTLYKVARPVSKQEIFSGRFREKIFNLYDIMRRNNGAGIAAPQVGWSVRIIWVGPITLINPEIKEVSPTFIDSYEGCLSLPDMGNFLVRRHEWVIVNYIALNGKKVLDGRFEGFESAVLQHEANHLNGITLFNNNNVIKSGGPR